MVAVKTRDVKYNFKELCSRIINGETMIVSRPKNENIVLISEREYTELERLRKNSEYLSMLDKSFSEAERGDIVSMSMAELRAME